MTIQPILDNCIYLVVSLVQTILQQATVLYIARCPAPLKKLFLSAGVLFFTNFAVSYFFHYLSFVAIGAWLLFAFLSYKFIFQQPFVKSCIMTLGQMLFMTFMEYIGQLIVFLIGGDFHAMTYEYNSYLRLIIAIVMLIVYFAMKTFSLRLLPINLSGRAGKLWAIYIIFIFLFSFPNLWRLEQNERIITSGIEVYHIILFLLFFLYNLAYIINLNKMSDISQQLEVQQLYAGTLQKSVDELRGFKHDFSNIITSINSLVQFQEWDQLEKYLQSTNTEVLKIKTSDIVNSEFMEQPILYGVMLSKVSLAEVTGVSFDVSVQCSLALHYCDLLDFSRMIGILLDNAIEAAAESEKRFVQMEITERRGQHRIVIRNSCGQDVDTEAIFEDEYSTKTDHSGHGLFQVKTMVEKYQNRGFAMELHTTCEDLVFTQILII